MLTLGTGHKEIERVRGCARGPQHVDLLRCRQLKCVRADYLSEHVTAIGYLRFRRLLQKSFACVQVVLDYCQPMAATVATAATSATVRRLDTPLQFAATVVTGFQRGSKELGWPTSTTAWPNPVPKCVSLVLALALRKRGLHSCCVSLVLAVHAFKFRSPLDGGIVI